MIPQRWFDILRLRARSIVVRSQAEDELNKEVRFHLAQQIDENVAKGLTPEEARYAALRRLGGTSQIQEECRDMRRTNYVENMMQDLRYAWRTLAKNPAFTVVMVLTLALAIGANSAIFSVIDGVLLKPLPYRDPSRIVRVYVSNPTFPKFRFNPNDFLDYRDRSQSFETLAGFTRQDVQLSGNDQPERLAAIRVTAGYFHMLGLQPMLGREFSRSDEVPANRQQVILSHHLWERRFNSDPNIVGSKITLDVQPFTVVGVMPPGVEHVGNDHQTLAQGDTVDLWHPFSFAADRSNRGPHYLDGIGRLKDGVTVEAATSELTAVARQVSREHVQQTPWRAVIIPLTTEVVGKSETLLLVLMGAVGFVLLIACANAANLLLARATGRSREVAVRAALGAGRSRLIRQMLTESLLIGVLGAAAGLVIAVAGVRVLIAFLPPDFPRAHAIHVDAVVFAFTFAIALLTGLLFGLAPALQTARTDVTGALRETGRSNTGSKRQLHLRDLLVVAEVSLSFMLLIGAGLMLRSFYTLLHTDRGFQTEHVLTANVRLPGKQYSKDFEIYGFFERLIARAAALPGVRYAGAGSDIPWTGYNENLTFFREGDDYSKAGHRVRFHGATKDYFAAAGIPIISGRALSDRDNADAPVIVVNQSLARKYFPGVDAVGKRITFTDEPKEKDWVSIAGVVGDVKDTPASAAAEPGLWFPVRLQPFSEMSIVIRSGSDPRPLIPALRRQLREMDPRLALSGVELMDQIAAAGVATPRFALFLVSLFASLALVLAAIGTYGVMAYSASERTHEFGVRMALGAQRSDVLALILGKGMRLAVVGIALGIGGALALARVLQSLLYGVKATDPLTFAAVSLMATAIAALACYIPARRATSVDPMNALRSE